MWGFKSPLAHHLIRLCRPCLQAYFATAADDFSAFEGTLNSINFPSDVQADAAQLKTATAAFVADLVKLKSSPSSQVNLNQLTSHGNAFDSDFRQVLNALSSPI
jgi:hypothetical protein